MSVEIGYPDRRGGDPVLTVSMFGQLDSTPKMATKLRRNMKAKLAELANSPSFVTVTRLKQAKAQAEAAIAALEERIGQTQARCQAGILDKPNTIAAAHKEVSRAKDKRAEVKLAFDAAEAQLPAALAERRATMKQAIAEIVADLKPRWQEAVRAAESAIYEQVTGPVSEHVALHQFWGELNHLHSADAETIAQYTDSPTAPEPAPTG